MKRLKNIEDKNEEQLKAIEYQKEVQTKIICKNKIKSPLLKSIYSQEVKMEESITMKQKKYLKFLKI